MAINKKRHKHGGGHVSLLPQRASDDIKKSAVKEYFLIFLVFLFGFGFFLWIFSRNDLIPMVDGPYYLIQVKSILTTGSLAYYGDPPLAFYLLSFFSSILGDVSLGVKVGVSFFCALSTVPAYFLMKKVGKSSFAGIIVMLLIIFSASYIRMLTDFMKNAIGVFFLFAFIYYLHDLVSSGFKKRNLALAIFFLVLTGMTHTLDFLVALLFFAIYIASVLVFNVNRKPFMKAAGAITLVILAFILIATTLFGSMFNDFSTVLSFVHDLTSQASGVGAAKAVPSPIGSGPIQAGSQPSGNSADMAGEWGVIFLIVSIGIALSFYAWKKKQKEELVLLVASTAVSAIICFPLIPSEWLFRTSLMIVVPAAMILSYGISRIWDSDYKKSKMIAMIIFAVCLFFFVGQSFRTIMDIRPLISDEGYLDLVNMKDQIPADSIVFTEHGILYWVKYVDEVEVAGIPIEQLSPELWRSYSHVLFIFSKDKVPPIAHEDIFIGKVLLLAEVRQTD